MTLWCACAALNGVSCAALNGVSCAALNGVSCAALNGVSCAALNGVSCAALNGVSCAVLNDVSCAALNDVSCAALNDVSCASADVYHTAPLSPGSVSHHHPCGCLWLHLRVPLRGAQSQVRVMAGVELKVWSWEGQGLESQCCCNWRCIVTVLIEMVRGYLQSCEARGANQWGIW